MSPAPYRGRPAAPSGRLTLKMVRAACLPSVFETGRIYYGDGRVVDVRLDGETVTGTILGYDAGYNGSLLKEIVAGTPSEDMLECSGRERRAEISLRTGRRLCSCSYLRWASVVTRPACSYASPRRSGQPYQPGACRDPAGRPRRPGPTTTWRQREYCPTSRMAGGRGWPEQHI